MVRVGLWGLPPFGHYPGPYGDILNAVGTSERHGTNIVTLINFDYRGFDTLGEEYMLFAAVIGAVVLLREHRGEETSARPGRISEQAIPARTDAVALGSRIALGLTIVFGIYVVLARPAHTGRRISGRLHRRLGDTAALYRPRLPRMAPPHEECGPRRRRGIRRRAPLSSPGSLRWPPERHFWPILCRWARLARSISAGLIPLVNFAVAIAVSAGFAVLFLEYLEETREPEGKDQE